MRLMIEIWNDSGKENFSNNKSHLSDFETNSSANEEDQNIDSHDQKSLPCTSWLVSNSKKRVNLR